MAFRQSKGSTIGIIKTGETVQHKFDSLDASIENLTNIINGKQGNGGGENVGTPWMYTAVGGETSFVVGFSGTIVRVPYLFINGIRQDLATNFTYTSATKTISLLNTQLVAGDSVTVIVMDDTNPTLSKLAANTGASLVGTSDGTTVQDRLDSIVTVKSFNDLRKTTPKYDGQIANLESYYLNGSTGGGKFRAHISSSVLSDDGGYIASDISSTKTYYWERITDRKEINLLDFGLKDGDTIDPMLISAFDAAVRYEVPTVRIPRSGNSLYKIIGGISYNLDRGSIELIGPGLDQSFSLQHSDNNTAITFNKSNGSIFNKAIVKNFKVNGNSGQSATFISFSDTWGNTLKDCFFTGYSSVNSAVVRLYNDKAWTENFIMDNVMFRGCGRGVLCYRNKTAGSTATDSFHALRITNSYFQYQVSGSTSFLSLGDGTAEGSVTVYGAHIELGGWPEGGGDSRAIRVNDYSTLIQSDVIFNNDGFGFKRNNFPTSISGVGFKLFRKSGLNGRIAVNCVNNGHQADGWDLTSRVLNSEGTATQNFSFPFWQILAEKTNLTSFAVNDSSDPISLKGAVVMFKGTIPGGFSPFKIKTTQLPLNSSFRVSISCCESNTARMRKLSYIVSTYNPQYVANVVNESSIPSYVAGVPSPTVTSTYNAGNPPTVTSTYNAGGSPSLINDNNVFSGSSIISLTTTDGKVAGTNYTDHGFEFDFNIDPSAVSTTSSLKWRMEIEQL